MGAGQKGVEQVGTGSVNATFTVEAVEPAEPKRVTIMLEEGDEHSDAQDVFVSVNGKPYVMQRSVWIEVPVEVVEVLNNAVIDRQVKVGDTITIRPSKRFPFRTKSGE